ncbi:MAG: PD-(D/E)XK nuclease family protein [Clostridia bacterium]|nr:PD-(D/E)XK nuclease family protein [Clostridia bacterium]
MPTLVFGAFGTGKTTYILERIAADLQAGRSALLVVPEQNTVSVEAAAARRLPPSAPLSFEVTNFTRLADTYFRRFGGVAERSADEGTALLLLRDAVAALAPALSDRRRVDSTRVLEVRAALRELSSAGIDAARLEEAAAAIGEEAPALSARLADLALIQAAYKDALADHGKHMAGDELVRLAELLEAAPREEDTTFYFDGFTSFTAVQLRILGALSAMAEVTVTVPMPRENRTGALIYAEPERTARDLHRLFAERGLAVSTVAFTENRRVRSGAVRALAERLFTPHPAPLGKEADDSLSALRILECRTPHSEAELCAADIARRVREGASYRDFAIVARHADAYRGVLDTALARHGIPAFFSLPTDLSSFEATKLIRTAYSVTAGNPRREDVITYMKCGLAGIEPDDCDRFELYAERWELSGRRLLTSPFHLPPEGYRGFRNEEERRTSEAALAALEATRRQMAEPLTILAKVSKGDFTIREHCEVLYEFLNALDVDKRLYDRARRLADAGDPARADKYARLFGAITDTLDRLCVLTPESRLSAEDFSDLLTLLFASQSLGTIPTHADAVTVGSADLLRPNEPRHVYLLGVNEGVFPKTAEGGGVFSPAEIALLGTHGIVLDGDEVVRVSREWFCFLRAFLAASESVTLSYTLASFAFDRVSRAEVLDKILALTEGRAFVLREEEIPLFDRIYTREGALAALGGALSAPERRAVLSALSLKGEEDLAALEGPLVDPTARLSSKALDLLYGKRMGLSQSRIESYIACPFSYLCQYVLRLSEDERAKLGSADIGNYVHAMLENFLAERREGMSSAEIHGYIEALTERYLADLFPGGAALPARVRHRFSRLAAHTERLLTEICEELDTVGYQPIYFEYEPSVEDESRAAPPAFTLKDGTRMTLYGKIDRVDVFRKDGNAYLRVVDYKTGTKKFSVDDVLRGHNMQLLIYLSALYKSDRAAFLKALGVGEGGRILPGGVLYLNLSLRTPTVSSPAEAGEEACTRSGLLLDDADSLNAMDPEGVGTFIPIKTNKDGTVAKTSLKSLATLEEMGRLLSDVEDIVKGAAEDLRGGVADASPLLDKGRERTCENCRYYPVCRNTGGRHKTEDK